MYIVFIVLIFIAAFFLILTVLAQNPKSGMAANFGASNQVMGVRQTADFLEKFTWTLSISIVVLSLAATMAMPSDKIEQSSDAIKNAIEQKQLDNKGFELPTNVSQPAGTPTTPTTPATPTTPTPAK